MKIVTYRRSVEADCHSVFDLTARAVSRLAPEFYPRTVVDTWMDGRAPQDYRVACAAEEIHIAEIDGVPVGFSHGEPGEIIRLFVEADHTGLGVGADLMELALADARSGNAATIKIEATLNAVPFYRKWGFTEFGRSTFPGRDAFQPEIETVLMQRSANPH